MRLEKQTIGAITQSYNLTQSEKNKPQSDVQPRESAGDDALRQFSLAINNRFCADMNIASKATVQDKSDVSVIGTKDISTHGDIAENQDILRPRMNVAKLLNKNIEDLQIKETTLGDGTIERIYTSSDNDKVLIKTHDKGTMHQEWVTGSSKADLIYLKQVGNGNKYIVAQNGNFTQIYNPSSSNGKPTNWKNAQYYDDGEVSLCRYPGRMGFNGQVKLYDPEAAKMRDAYPGDKYIAALNPDYHKYQVICNNVSTHGFRPTSLEEDLAQQKVDAVKDVADTFLLDLEDIANPYTEGTTEN